MELKEHKSRAQKFIEAIVFESRWILVPFYLGLIVAQVFYCFKFCAYLMEFAHEFNKLDETKIMLMVLTLIDITMIGNLIKMIISGSYQTFVSPLDNDHTEKISSGLLKVKMGSSLVGVSSIHLLQAFINSSALPMRELLVKSGIHMIFLLSTIGLAYVDYLHSLSKKLHETHSH